jgi:hypothetical protein
MPLSLHITQGNARRVAGKKGPAKRARISVFAATVRFRPEQGSQ